MTGPARCVAHGRIDCPWHNDPAPAVPSGGAADRNDACVTSCQFREPCATDCYRFPSGDTAGTAATPHCGTCMCAAASAPDLPASAYDGMFEYDDDDVPPSAGTAAQTGRAQRQDSLEDQMIDVLTWTRDNGCYDAYDWIMGAYAWATAPPGQSVRS